MFGLFKKKTPEQKLMRMRGRLGILEVELRVCDEVYALYEFLPMSLFRKQLELRNAVGLLELEIALLEKEIAQC